MFELVQKHNLRLRLLDEPQRRLRRTVRVDWHENRTQQQRPEQQFDPLRRIGGDHHDPVSPFHALRGEEVCGLVGARLQLAMRESFDLEERSRRQGQVVAILIKTGHVLGEVAIGHDATRMATATAYSPSWDIDTSKCWVPTVACGLPEASWVISISIMRCGGANDALITASLAAQSPAKC